MEHVLCCIECRSERVRLQTDEVLETLDDTVDMQCSDDSGDDDLMMVGSDYRPREGRFYAPNCNIIHTGGRLRSIDMTCKQMTSCIVSMPKQLMPS